MNIVVVEVVGAWYALAPASSARSGWGCAYVNEKESRRKGCTPWHGNMRSLRVTHAAQLSKSDMLRNPSYLSKEV